MRLGRKASHEPERKRNVANPWGRPHETRRVSQLNSASAPEQDSSFERAYFGHLLFRLTHAQLLHARKGVFAGWRPGVDADCAREK